MIGKPSRRHKCNKCGLVAELVVSINKEKRTSKIYLCKDCVVDLYFEISKFITPKSPVNILNNFKR